MAIPTVDQAWADYNADGTVKEPNKLDIRLNLRALWAIASANGMKTYATKAIMDADTTQPDGQPAVVYADPTPANNYPTVWIWDDAGNQWIGGTDRIGDLETRFDEMINLWSDPTASAINAPSTPGVPSIVSGEVVVEFTTAGTYNAVRFPATKSFAIGATIALVGDKQSDATGANISYAALVFLNADGGEISRSQWLTSSTTGRETFTVPPVAVPANTVTVEARYGKGSSGTSAKFWPETFVLASSVPPQKVAVVTHNGLEPLRDIAPASINAALSILTNRIRVPGPNGDVLARWHNEAWRGDDGKVLSTADGPCTVPGVKYVFAFRDAKADNGKVYELWDQARTMKLVPIGTAPVIRDRGGIAHTNGTGRLGAENTVSKAARLVSMVQIPDDETAVPLVPTGLARVPLASGIKYAGYFVQGNDGRPDEGSSDYHGTIRLRSPDDGRAMVAEWDMEAAIPALTSIQGVAVRIDAGTPSIYFVDTGNKFLRQIDFTGVRIPAGDVDLSGYGAQPNGLAYDAALDAFWVGYSTDGKAVLIPAAGGAQIRQIAVPTSTDHLTYDGEYLWITAGNNGANGLVRPYDPVTGCRVDEYSDLRFSQAIEGAVIERTPNGGIDIWTINDGRFHDTASPQTSTILKFRSEIAPPPRITTNKLLISVVMRTTATPAGTQYVFMDGTPGDTAWYGWALAVRSVSGGLRFQARQPGDAAVINIDVVGAAIADGKYHIVTVEADRGTNTATIYVDGVSVGSGSIAGIGRDFQIGRLGFFGGPGSGSAYLNGTRVLAAAVADNAIRADVEAYLTDLCRGAPNS